MTTSLVLFGPKVVTCAQPTLDICWFIAKSHAIIATVSLKVDQCLYKKKCSRLLYTRGSWNVLGLTHSLFTKLRWVLQQVHKYRAFSEGRTNYKSESNTFPNKLPTLIHLRPNPFPKSWQFLLSNRRAGTLSIFLRKIQRHSYSNHPFY